MRAGCWEGQEAAHAEVGRDGDGAQMPAQEVRQQQLSVGLADIIMRHPLAQLEQGSETRAGAEAACSCSLADCHIACAAYPKGKAEWVVHRQGLWLLHTVHESCHYLSCQSRHVTNYRDRDGSLACTIDTSSSVLACACG